MRAFLLVILLFAGIAGFSQTGVIRCIITNTDSANTFSTVSVDLRKDTQNIFSGYKNFNHPFVFQHLMPGWYILSCSTLGERKQIHDSLQVSNERISEFVFNYPGPCKFIYTKNYQPKCSFGHADNIIPIIYGLPDKRMMEKSKKGKAYLGGCVVSDCDPRYYCKIHKVEI